MAALSRAALGVLEWPYTAAVQWRNYGYDHRRRTIYRVGVPVVSVGNITLGGTGKTPAIEWLARWFAAQGVRVGLVSRGYGSQAGQANDEALELAQKLPGVPHVLDPDRVRGARQVIRQFHCQAVLLDDAFQHRRIARDLDIVLVDASEPFGYGHVFPRGTLREPLAGWSRAHVVMLSRAELADDEQRAAIREHVRRYAPAAVWVEATHAPHALRSTADMEQRLSVLAGKRVAAFCGIGNPAGFRHALAACRYEVVALRELADHCSYTAAGIEALAHWSDNLDVAGVLCTGKDLVKIGPRWPGTKPLWALSSRIEIVAGREEFEAVLWPIAQRAKGGV
jgi:tetraacyldisaccharide 4'-kinase